MLKIGRLRLEGRGEMPRSRRELKSGLRAFGRELGLDIRFVHRKKKNVSYCSVIQKRAIICESIGGYPVTMSRLIGSTLHEIAHWIDFNEGFYKKFYSQPYYDTCQNPELKDVKRLVLRAERHCNWVARKLSIELYGREIIDPNIYDEEYIAEAREFIRSYYKWS